MEHINPYVEAYKFRDNMWGLYSESLDGMGDPRYCTIQALRDALKKLQPRFEEIGGAFSGHSMPDQSWLSLQYLLDTCERVLENPLNYLIPAPDCLAVVKTGPGTRPAYSHPVLTDS